MIVKEDKQAQALARIEAALKKRTLARQLIAQAEHELWEAGRMLEELRAVEGAGPYEEAEESNG
jgi:hypothetical protein